MNSTSFFCSILLWCDSGSTSEAGHLLTVTRSSSGKINTFAKKKKSKSFHNTHKSQELNNKKMLAAQPQAVWNTKSSSCAELLLLLLWSAQRGQGVTFNSFYLSRCAINFGDRLLLQEELWFDWPWIGWGLQGLDGEGGVEAGLHVVVSGALLGAAGWRALVIHADRRKERKKAISQLFITPWKQRKCGHTWGKPFVGQVGATPPRLFDWLFESLTSLLWPSSILRIPSGREGSGWLTNL